MVGRSRMLSLLQQHCSSVWSTAVECCPICNSIVRQHGRPQWNVVPFATTFFLSEFGCASAYAPAVEYCPDCNNILVQTFAKSHFVQATAPVSFSRNGDREMGTVTYEQVLVQLKSRLSRRWWTLLGSGTRVAQWSLLLLGRRSSEDGSGLSCSGVDRL